MATKIIMEATGIKTDKNAGEVSNLSYDLGLTHDQSTGTAGARIHAPVTATFSQSSAGLLEKLYRGKQLDNVTFKIQDTDKSGNPVDACVIKLKNARVARSGMAFSTVQGAPTAHTVAFLYESIDVTDAHNVTATDTWQKA